MPTRNPRRFARPHIEKTKAQEETLQRLIKEHATEYVTWRISGVDRVLNVFAKRKSYIVARDGSIAFEHPKRS
jgi:hypothetical protein